MFLLFLGSSMPTWVSENKKKVKRFKGKKNRVRGGLGFPSSKRLMEIECLSKNKGISNVRFPVPSGNLQQIFQTSGSKEDWWVCKNITPSLQYLTQGPTHDVQSFIFNQMNSTEPVGGQMERQMNKQMKYCFLFHVIGPFGTAVQLTDFFSEKKQNVMKKTKCRPNNNKENQLYSRIPHIQICNAETDVLHSFTVNKKIQWQAQN